jgi:hypothetical protein
MRPRGPVRSRVVSAAIGLVLVGCQDGAEPPDPTDGRDERDEEQVEGAAAPEDDRPPPGAAAEATVPLTFAADGGTISLEVPADWDIDRRANEFVARAPAASSPVVNAAVGPLDTTLDGFIEDQELARDVDVTDVEVAGSPDARRFVRALDDGTAIVVVARVGDAEVLVLALIHQDEDGFDAGAEAILDSLTITPS